MRSYDQIKHKEGNRHQLPPRVKSPWKLFKPDKPKGPLKFGKSKFFGGKYTFVIREYNSASLMSHMALLQYRHISIRWRSCSGINGRTYVLTLFAFFIYQVLHAQSFSIWVKWLKYLLLTEVSLFDRINFWDVLWCSYHALLFLLIGEQCLIWRVHLVYSLMVNSASYFLLLVIQFVWV